MQGNNTDTDCGTREDAHGNIRLAFFVLDRVQVALKVKRKS